MTGVQTCALPISGDPLRHAIKAGPDIVAPNINEAEALIGHEFSDDADFIQATRQLSRMGAGSGIITHSGGCYAYFKEDNGDESTYKVTISPLDPISTVGSGDSFLAGFVSAMLAGKDRAYSLRYGVACGAASTQKYGAGIFDPHDANSLLTKVKAEEQEL